MIISFILRERVRQRVRQDRTDRNAGRNKLILTVKTSLRARAAHSLSNRALKCMQRANIGCCRPKETARKTYRIIQLFFRSSQPFLTRKRLIETAQSTLLQTGGHAPFARDGARTKKKPVWKSGGCATAAAVTPGRKGRIDLQTYRLPPEKQYNRNFQTRSTGICVSIHWKKKSAQARIFFSSGLVNHHPYISLWAIFAPECTRVPCRTCTAVHGRFRLYSCSCQKPDEVKKFSLYLFFKNVDISAMTCCTMSTKFTAVVLNNI